MTDIPVDNLWITLSITFERSRPPCTGEAVAPARKTASFFSHTQCRVASNSGSLGAGDVSVSKLVLTVWSGGCRGLACWLSNGGSQVCVQR
jgi:hypothetical protein